MHFAMGFRKALLLPVLALCACAGHKTFCPQDYQVDFPEALRFAEKAALAYAPPDSVRREACGKDSCYFFKGETTATRSFLLIDDSARVQWIGFRGTASLSDVRLDADYTQREDSVLGMYLHRGFASAARDHYRLLLPKLKPGYPVYITGHSLGGAVAVITGLYLRKQGFAVKCYTFGQPKVTNGKGARIADSLDLVRFLNGKDLVALVPPLDWKPGAKLGGYEHFGREVALLPGTGFECLQKHFPKRNDPSAWWDNARREALEDHLLSGYLLKLKGIIDAQAHAQAQTQALTTGH